MTRYAKRTDDNHRDVVDELRHVLPEASVTDMSGIGKGIPDIMVGWMGRNFLFEIKDGAKSASQRDLTEAQKDFHLKWHGQAHVVTSAAEICAILARLAWKTPQ